MVSSNLNAGWSVTYRLLATKFELLNYSRAKKKIALIFIKPYAHAQPTSLLWEWGAYNGNNAINNKYVTIERWLIAMVGNFLVFALDRYLKNALKRAAISRKIKNSGFLHLRLLHLGLRPFVTNLFKFCFAYHY